MSGRALRRLPVLALARYLGMGSITSCQGDVTNGLAAGAADIDTWLNDMDQVIQEQARERDHLQLQH